MLGTSGLALVGGLPLWARVPNGPFRQPAAQFDASAGWTIFGYRPFRQVALGYFGHMWELYTFWAFVPLLLATHAQLHPETGSYGPGWAFGMIATCVAGGYLARQVGDLRTARTALAVSGGCCLLSPLLLALPRPAFAGAMLVWGMAVVADSPQFSALVARRAPAAATGTALTLVTCLGFALTIVSLQCFAALQGYVATRYLFLLPAPGPVLGLAGHAPRNGRGRTRNVTSCAILLNLAATN